MPLLLAGALLAVAVIFGGGGVPAPTPELGVELFALAAFAVWLVLRSARGEAPGMDLPLFLIVGAFVAIPAIQLIPLPAAIWSALPGRDIVVQAAALAGKPGAWLPLSMAPYRTLASLIGLVVPMAMFCMAVWLPVRTRVRLLLVLAALSVLAGLVGVIQTISGGSLLNFYPTHLGYAVGLQANRNSSADLLLIGLCALVASAWALRDRLEELPMRAAVAAAALFLVLQVVLTGSRAGTGLLIVPVLVGVGLFLPKISKRRAFVIAGVGVALVAVVAIAIPSVPMLERTAQRFSEVANEQRPELWEDAAYAARQVAPVGSGVGTVVPMMVASERLEVVDPAWPNRAHNDFLEFALEAGIAGVALMLAVVLGLFVRVPQLLRASRSRAETAGIAFACGTAAVILLHSTVDYPLRSLSLATLAALAASFLIDNRAMRPRAPRPDHQESEQ